MCANDSALRASPAQRRCSRLVLSAAILAILNSPALLAATFTVSNNNDAGAGSLRQAILDANLAAGDDTVLFDSTVTGSIVLTSGRIDILGGLSLSGPGASSLTLSGNNSSQVLYIGSLGMASVSISDLGFRDGLANGAQLDQRLGGCVVVSNATVSLQRVQISGCSASYAGGGIGLNGSASSLSLSNASIMNNSSGFGGGVAALEALQPVTISDSTISGNSASDHGGGVALRFLSGTATISNSTVSGNQANQSAGVSVLGMFGALQVLSSTISGNTASSGSGGGMGIAGLYGGNHRIAHSTIAGNSASTGGGGVFLSSGGLRQASRAPAKGGVVLSLSHSLLADNLSAGAGNDLAGAGGGPSTSIAFSLLETATAYPFTDAGGNLAAADPQLGPLQNNGGSRFTHLPGGSSVVINAGDAAIATPPATDQRGFSRVVGSRIDVGAVEVNSGNAGFASTTASVNETAGSVTLTVNRNGGTDGAVSLDYASGGGSASAGSDYTSANGSLNWANGESAAKQIVVTILNDTLVEPDETVNVSLSNPGGGLSLSAADTATVTIVSDDVAMPGTVQLQSASFSIAEDSPGKAMLTVNALRSGGSDGAASVQFTTSDGSAMAPGDYTSVSGTLNWADGESGNRGITLTVLADGLFEPDETFNLSLSNASGASLGTPGAAVITIPANGTPPMPGSIQLQSASFSIAEDSPGKAMLTVNALRSGGSDGAASVQFATSDGSAMAPGDYTSVSGTLNWADGESGNRGITLTVLADGLFEPDETFNLSLSNATGASLGTPGAAVITIPANGTPPMSGTIQLESASYAVLEDQPGKLLLTINALRSGGSEGAVSVQFATADGSAMAPGDYMATSGTLNWADGQSGNRPISLMVLADSLVEPDENFSLNLSNPTGGATLGAISSSTITIAANGAAPAPTLIPGLDWRGLSLLFSGMLVAGWIGLRRRVLDSVEGR